MLCYYVYTVSNTASSLINKHGMHILYYSLVMHYNMTQPICLPLALIHPAKVTLQRPSWRPTITHTGTINPKSNNSKPVMS